MKAIVFGLFMLISFGVFAQEDEVTEEFLPIEVEGKEAFMSTKTGEFTFREHIKTDPTQLKTTASGVVYTEITNHSIKKGETLSGIAKKYGVSLSEIKKHNKANSSNLKIGSNIKIVKNLLIKSSSPTISYAGEERIIARLRPGESPGQFAAPPSVAEVESQVIETKKTEEKPSSTIYKAESSVKNPIFGIGNAEENEEEESTQDLSEAIKQELAGAEIETVTESETDEVEEKVLEKTEAIEPIETKAEPIEVVEEKVEIEAEAEKEIEIEETVIEASENKPIEEEVVEADITSEENKTDFTYHTVVKGNTLWLISKKYGTTVKELKKLNNLAGFMISPGQKLKVSSKK